MVAAVSNRPIGWIWIKECIEERKTMSANGKRAISALGTIRTFLREGT